MFNRDQLYDEINKYKSSEREFMAELVTEMEYPLNCMLKTNANPTIYNKLKEVEATREFIENF